VLAFTAFPKEVWRQISEPQPNERLNRKIRRRTDVVGIFPDRDADMKHELVSGAAAHAGGMLCAL
jgi:transposase-like protein